MYSSFGMDMLQLSCGHPNNQRSLLPCQNAWIVETEDLCDEHCNTFHNKGMINCILSKVALLHKRNEVSPKWIDCSLGKQ